MKTVRSVLKVVRSEMKIVRSVLKVMRKRRKVVVWWFLSEIFKLTLALYCLAVYENNAICLLLAGDITFIKLFQEDNVKLNLYIVFNLVSSVFRSCSLKFFANTRRSILIKMSFVKVLFASTKLTDCKKCIVVSEFKSIKA